MWRQWVAVLRDSFDREKGCERTPSWRGGWLQAEQSLRRKVQAVEERYALVRREAKRLMKTQRPEKGQHLDPPVTSQLYREALCHTTLRSPGGLVLSGGSSPTSFLLLFSLPVNCREFREVSVVLFQFASFSFCHPPVISRPVGYNFVPDALPVVPSHKCFQYVQFPEYYLMFMFCQFLHEVRLRQCKHFSMFAARRCSSLRKTIPLPSKFLLRSVLLQRAAPFFVSKWSWPSWLSSW